MNRVLFHYFAAVTLAALSLAMPAHGQEAGINHIRGQITSVNASSITVKAHDGGTLQLEMPETITILSLSKGSFADVNFGSYVGAVAVRLDMESPIVKAIPRDSVNWLYQGYEFRILDERLRGVGIGVQQWDVPAGSKMTHGWVDDIEGPVVSIKYGPTREEETDVIVARNVPVMRMTLGDRSLIKPGANIFAGAQKSGNGKSVAAFIIVGRDGVVPAL